MTDVTSEAPKQTDQPDSNGFPIITDWRIRIMKGAHIADFMPVILETVLSSLPPEEKVNPTMRANISGAIVDGRLQVWGILGKVKGTDQWRPVGYGTTSIRNDELSGTSSLLIYTLFTYAVIEDRAYRTFWEAITDYAKDQGCVKVGLYTENPRVLQMAETVGMETKWHYVFKNLR